MTLSEFKRIKQLKNDHLNQLKEWGVEFKKHSHDIESIEFVKPHAFTADEIADLIDTKHELIELCENLQAEVKRKNELLESKDLIIKSSQTAIKNMRKDYEALDDITKRLELSLSVNKSYIEFVDERIEKQALAEQQTQEG